MSSVSGMAAPSVFDSGTVAAQIKALYTAHIRARGGRWAGWGPGAANPSVWCAAADVCLNSGLDPRSHVVALLRAVRKPFPNMLLGQRAVERTLKYMAEEANDEYARTMSQLAFMRGRLRLGETVESVLGSREYALTSAFRYYVAAAVGLPAVAAAFEEAANRELRLCPARKVELDKVFRRSGDGNNG